MTSQTPSRHAAPPQPIQSPFPLSPLDSSQNNNRLNHGLTQRHLQEIQTVFRIFDPNLNGFIDARTFEVLTRSLGHRMTPAEVQSEIDYAWEERLLQSDEHDQRMMQQQVSRWVDLPMVISILAKKGYGKRTSSDEVRMYFRLFDRDNKGYITMDDLTRFQGEIAETQNELRSEMGDLDVLQFQSVDDATLKLMMDEFDANKDGVIDLEEFGRIVEPILS